MHTHPHMTPKDEAGRILDLCHGNLLEALELLERQMNTLHARAQVLLSLASLTITISGFSGRAIAGSSMAAKLLIIAGLLLALLSAVFVFLRVMQLRWVTAETTEEPRAMLEQIITRRTMKTRAYRLGGRVLGLGLFFYALAFAIMLMSA
jgi:hypothetical protein